MPPPPCGSYHRDAKRFGLKILFAGLLFVLLFGLFVVPVAGDDDLSPTLRVLSIENRALISIDGGTIYLNSPIIFALDVPANANIKVNQDRYPEEDLVMEITGTGNGLDSHTFSLYVSDTVGTTEYIEYFFSSSDFPNGEYDVKVKYQKADGTTEYTNAVSFTVSSEQDIALSGLGTESNPYLIQLPAHLKLLSDEVKSGKTFADTYFAITDNLDLSFYTAWQPIGDMLIGFDLTDTESPYGGIVYYAYSQNIFCGIVDGRGNTISHLKTDNTYGGSAWDFNGLFGVVGPGTVIKNLILMDVDVSSGGYYYTGGLIGGIYGYKDYGSDTILIENCHVEGYVDGNGGLIGRAYTEAAPITISKCSAKISGILDTMGGGLIGEVDTYSSSADVTITECFAYLKDGIIQAEAGFSSSISAVEGSILIKDCYVSGDDDITTMAGLFNNVRADSASSVTIENCYSDVIVSSGVNLGGGLIGGMDAVDKYSGIESSIGSIPGTLTVKNSVYLGNSVTGDTAGKIVGAVYQEGGEITLDKLYAIDDVELTSYSSNDNRYDGLTVSSSDVVTQSFYENTLGWDFDTVWKMDSSVSPYPILQQISTPEPVEEYTITFGANGGTGSMNSATILEGDSYTLPACTFTAPEGQVFKAWLIDSIEYDVGDSYRPTSDVTAYAVWVDKMATPDSFSITYPTNGAILTSTEEIDVTWTAADGATSYLFTLRDLTIHETAAEGKVIPDTDIGNVLTYTIVSTYLIDGHNYRVAVCAVNDAGAVWEEAEFSINTRALLAGVPTMQSPSASDVYYTGNDITVTWTAPATNPDSYTIWLYGGGNDAVSFTGITENTYTIPGSNFANAGSYSVEVYAIKEGYLQDKPGNVLFEVKEQISSTAQKLVDTMMEDLGKTATDLNYDVPWCAYFIGDSAKKAGMDDIIPRRGATGDLLIWFSDNVGTTVCFPYPENSKNIPDTQVQTKLQSLSSKNQAPTYLTSYESFKPQVGDIVGVLWDSDVTRTDKTVTISHVEVVYEIEGDIIKTISGNTANKVGLHEFNWKTGERSGELYGNPGTVVAYARPAYDEEEISLPGSFVISLPEDYTLAGPITVTWTASSGATGYKVALRDLTISEEGDEGKLISNEPIGNVLKYTIEEKHLVDGHQYRIAVCAYNADGKERWVENEFKISSTTLPEHLHRDVVLLVETSDLTSKSDDTIISITKEVTERLLSSESPTRVSIIAYSDTAYTISEFSSDIDYIEDRINSFTWGFYANMYDGLQAVERVFENGECLESSKKSVVIISAGLPNAGTEQTYGLLRLPGDTTLKHVSVPYGNAVHDFYSHNLKDKYDVYVLQCLNPSTLVETSVSNTLLSEIQNNGLYHYKQYDNIGLIPGIKDVHYTSDVNNGKSTEGLYFTLSENTGTFSVIYDDELFKNPSTEYNHDIAKISLGLAAAASTATGTDYNKDLANDVRARNLKDSYTRLGYTDVTYYNYNVGLDDSSNKVAYAIAEKELILNGEHTIIYNVVIRGKGYGAEWASNFDFGTGLYASGFSEPTDDIYLSLKEKLSQSNTNAESIKIWISGFGRGGAVANLLAAKLDRESLSLNLDKNDIYAYTFATMQGVDTSHSNYVNDDTDYSNIFNIVNPSDIFSSIPFTSWDYGRYGNTYYFDYSKLNQLSSTISQEYQSLVGDYASYIPINQEVAVSVLDLRLGQIFESKTQYARVHSDYVKSLAEILFYEKNGDLGALFFMPSSIEEIYPNGKQAIDNAEETISNNPSFNECVNDFRYRTYLLLDYVTQTDAGSLDLVMLMFNAIPFLTDLDSDNPAVKKIVQTTITIEKVAIFIIDIVKEGIGLIIECMELGCIVATSTTIEELRGPVFATIYVGEEIKEMAKSSALSSAITEIITSVIELCKNITDIIFHENTLTGLIAIGNIHGHSEVTSLSEFTKIYDAIGTTFTLSHNGANIASLPKQNYVDVYMSWLLAADEKYTTENANKIYVKNLATHVVIDELLVDVTVLADGFGDVYGSQRALIGGKILIEAIPDDGVEFIGWYDKHSNLISTEPMSLIEITEENPTYTAVFGNKITYYLDGGVNHPDNPGVYDKLDSDIVLKDPTKEGYVFAGWTWSYQPNPTKDVVIKSGSTGNKKFNANWKRIEDLIDGNADIPEWEIYRVQIPDASPGEYVEITPINIEIDTVVLENIPAKVTPKRLYEITGSANPPKDKKAKIYFYLLDSEIPESVSYSDVAMYHYVNSKWERLPTYYDGPSETGIMHTFHAETTGFSLFAIVFESSVESSSVGSSKDTVSGNYAEYPRTVTNGGYVDFGTSPVVKGVTLPKGVNGKVVLIAKSKTPAPEGKETYGVFEINVDKYPIGDKSVISFTIPLSDLQKKGFTEKDICLYHFGGEVWTKLPTTYTVEGDKALYEAETTAFSPFAIVYEKNGAVSANLSEIPVEPEKPSDEPGTDMPSPSETPEDNTQETESPAPVLGLTLGVLGAAVLMRRR